MWLLRCGSGLIKELSKFLVLRFLVCGFGFLMVLATSRRVSTNGSMFNLFLVLSTGLQIPGRSSV